MNSGNGNIDLRMKSEDGGVAVRVKGAVADRWPVQSGFSDLAEASAFFESGSLGYSVTRDPRRLDGITLHTHGWRIEALEITNVYSSYFANETQFPKGSVEFDCALIMRDVAHEWHTATDLMLTEPCCA